MFDDFWLLLIVLVVGMLGGGAAAFYVIGYAVRRWLNTFDDDNWR